MFAHNLKGYDGYFLLEYLIDQSIRPSKIIYNGSKIMYLDVGKGLNIKVLDSLNFLPMKLAALPKAFGLRELRKGHFPHFFNTKVNQEYMGSYPEPKYYGVDFMGVKEREEFFAWYDTVKNDAFHFRNEMLEYCRSDVDILRQACLRFRTLMMESTGRWEASVDRKEGTIMKLVDAVDPYHYVTIASVCMGIYRTKFLEEKWRVRVSGEDDWIPAKMVEGKLVILWKGEWVLLEDIEDVTVEKREFVSTPIAQVPSTGYRDQYSKASIEWLEWMAQKDGVIIRHALNGGEKKVGKTRYKLDGYCAETDTAYEFHGCIFHSCPVCFPNDRDQTIHPLTGQTMTELYALTQKKKAFLERIGMKYVCIWEHEFRDQRKADPELRRFLATLDLVDRLNPRDSFFGGRTNASKLYHKVDGDEKIQYVDFTSLYPWVNKYCQYPAGHPTILTSDFGDMDDYFGIAQVKILPPRGLYHPVLPYRSNGKLKFPLCRTCADSENQDPCTCTDEERAMTGTWCTPELQMAVRKGYAILKTYSVYHWEETTQYDEVTGEGGLFAKYINTFLKIKQEASGPPDWIQSPQDMSKYVRKYFEKEGVTLDSDQITKNPGLRALAKLCLNSFWGKLGQRLNLKQTEFIHESEVDRFFQLLTTPTKDVQNFHVIADDMIQMEWAYKNDFQPDDAKTNIYLATFTTCWARLKLYGVLDRLGERVLYYDTDSVIYVSRSEEYDPPLGDYLGELTNELEGGDYITEFVSGGPKNYAYRTHSGKETCKVRGFTLNFINSQIINFQTVKDIVTTEEAGHVTTVNPRKICRDKLKRKLYNREEEKKYQMVYTKRVKLENFDTRPYGY
ncbi:hypothetical protein BOV97_12840 [Solemya velum gill symbiont]|nr:hypothetical protein BOV97_12840 [Solemya velum gill symbiont]